MSRPGEAARPPGDPAADAARWQRVAVAAVGALVALSVAWEWWLAPLRPGGSLLVLKAVPLVLLLPGLVRGRLRPFQLGSMLILIYVAEGVVRGMTDPAPMSTLGWIETALAAIAFGAILAHVRSRRLAAA